MPPPSTDAAGRYFAALLAVAGRSCPGPLGPSPSEVHDRLAAAPLAADEVQLKRRISPALWMHAGELLVDQGQLDGLESPGASPPSYSPPGSTDGGQSITSTALGGEERTCWTDTSRA